MTGNDRCKFIEYVDECDNVTFGTRVKVTEDELEALRRFYEDVEVDELEAMTAEEKARFADSMPESVRNLLYKLMKAAQAARDRAMLEQMSRYMDREADRLLQYANGGER